MDRQPWDGHMPLKITPPAIYGVYSDDPTTRLVCATCNEEWPCEVAARIDREASAPRPGGDEAAAAKAGRERLVAPHPWIECLTDGAAWCNRCDDRADNCLQPPTGPIPLEDWLARLRLFVVQHADCGEGRGDVE